MSDSDRGGSDQVGLKRWLWPAIIFALLVIGAAGIQHRIHYNNAARNAAAYARDAQNQIAAECRVPLSRESCARQIEQTRRSNQREEYDLYSQQVMALWTAIVGAMAIFGIALSGIGIYLIWRTWGATREAVIETRRIGEAQTRAYLSVTAASVKIAKDKIPEIRFTVKNSGNSPARELIPAYQILYLVFGSRKERDISALKSSPDAFEIPAGAEYPLPPMAIPDGFDRPVLEAFNAKNGKLAIKVVLSMVWKDVFGTEDVLVSRWSAIVGDFEGSVCALEQHAEMAAISRNELVRRDHQKRKRQKS